MATQPGEVTALDASELDELADLRRRGYGPGEGLTASAADRLRSLEERVHDAKLPDAALPRGDRDETDAPSTSRVPPDPETPEEPSPDRRSARRHPVLLALAATVAAAGLVALGFVLAQPPESVDAGSLGAVALDEDRAAVVVGTASFSIRDLDPDSLVQYASLGQGTPWSAMRPDGGRCLFLTVTDDSPEMIAAAGVWDVACAPPGLDPIIDWRVDRSYPSPPQTLPEGSVVRLTLDDDDVRMSIGRSE